jgi:hypothetical protein
MAFRDILATINTSTPTLVFQAQPGDVEVWLNMVGAPATWTVLIGGDSSSQTFPLGAGQLSSDGPFHMRVRPGDEVWALSSITTHQIAALVRSA